MSTKISCGGFYIDDETLSLSDDNKLSVKNGGSGGGGSEAIIIHDGDGAGILDKTWQEISDAVEAGSVAMLYNGSDIDRSIGYLSGLFSDDGDYGVGFVDYATGSARTMLFVADSADGYPVIDNQ